MTDKVLIDRELLAELRDAASECLDREDRQRRQMIYSRLVSDSDAILAQPQPAEPAAVEVVTTWHPDSRSYEEQEVKLDTKGSRKALGAMNAKLRAKVGRLERELAAEIDKRYEGNRLASDEHAEEVERLRGIITRLESGIPRLQEQAFQLRTQLDQARALLRQAGEYGGLTPAWHKQRDAHLSSQAK